MPIAAIYVRRWDKRTLRWGRPRYLRHADLPFGKTRPILARLKVQILVRSIDYVEVRSDNGRRRKYGYVSAYPLSRGGRFL